MFSTIRARVFLAIGFTLTVFACREAKVGAHEGHQPLPTTGVEVDTQSGRVTLSARARSAIGVQTEEVVVGKVASTLDVYAETITPWHSKAFGSAQIAGRIAKLLVRPGDVVAKDQVVAELSSRELELVRLDYLQASNELILNARLLEMTRPSAEAGAVPMQRLLDVENAYEQSRNRLEVARLRARTLGVSLDDANLDESKPLLHPIRSPIAGRILHLDLAEGKYVEEFEHLFDVVNTDQVWLRLQLLEKDLLRAPIGSRVTALFPTVSLSVEGVIDQLDAALDSTTQVSSAWVTLAAPQLVPGLVGKATVFTSEQADKLTVPQRAVYSDGLQHYVFVEEASTRTSAEYRKQAIRLGARRLVANDPQDTMWEVLQGDVFPGDRVVVQGGHELSSLFFLGVLKLSPNERQRLGIETQSAAYRKISRTLQLPAMATLPPESRAVVTSQIDGTVQSHSLSPGRWVTAGETLLQVASPEFYQLQLDLISATLDAELSRRRAERLNQVKGDAVSLRMQLEARSRAEQLESRSASLKRQLATLGLLDDEITAIVRDRKVLNSLPVRSSIDGQIASSVVTLGETVAANQTLVEIQNRESVWVEAYVPSSELHAVSKAASAWATMLASAEHRFPLSRAQVSPTVDEATRTQRVWFTPRSTSDPKSPTAQLRAGSLLSVTLPIDDPTMALTVPVAAVLRDGLHAFAFVLKVDGALERRRLVIGRSDGQHIEVLSGLTEGEQVVTTGSRELHTAYASLR